MNSDSESLAFVEEDTDIGTPTPVRPASAAAGKTSGARPPLHHNGSGSPSAFVAPTARGNTSASGVRTSQQRGLARSGSVTSNASLAFHFEAEDATPPPERGGPQRSGHSAGSQDNTSIVFHADDSQDSSPRHAGYAAQASAGGPVKKGQTPSPVGGVPNDSIAFQFDEDSPHSTGRPPSRNASPITPLPTSAAAERGQGRVTKPAPTARAAAAPAASTVTNDSIAFNFDDELSHGSGQAHAHGPPQRLSPSTFPPMRLPTMRHGSSTGGKRGPPSDIGDGSIAFQEEEEEDEGAHAAPHVPPALTKPSTAAPPTVRVLSQLRPDASASSIQFAMDPEEEAGAPGPAFVRTPSVAGSSVSATFQQGKPKKTVVSNHLRQSSARSSPARTRPSPKVTPETHPPLYQSKRTSTGTGAGSGKAEPTTPAEVVEASRRDAAHQDPVHAAPTPTTAAADGQEKRRRQSRTSSEGKRAEGEKGRRHRHRTTSEGAVAQGVHRRRRRVPRSSSAAARGEAAEAPPVTPRDKSDSGSHSGRGSSSHEGKKEERSSSTDSTSKGPRAVSESVPGTARTQRPDRRSSEHNRRHSRDHHHHHHHRPQHHMDVHQRVATHLDHLAAENEYFRDGHEQARRASEVGSGGSGVASHQRTGTNAFIEASYPPLAVTSGSARAREHAAAEAAAAAAAAQQTEMWRVFNAQQREEIERLQRRIAAAKRQDRTVLEGNATGGRGVPEQRQSTARGRTGSPGYAAAGARSGTATYLDRAKTARSGSQQRLLSPSPQPQPTAVPLAATAHSTTGNASAVRRRQGNRSQRVVSASLPLPRELLATDSSAETVAQLLGILWPPARPGELYFVTGSRLTPQQTESFYETVRVQQQQDAREAAALRAQGVGDSATSRSPSTPPRQLSAPGTLTVWSPSKMLRASSPRESLSLPLHSARTRRPTVRRSQVLREVFDLVDSGRRGVLYASEIPAMQHLIALELAKAEAQTSGAASTKARHGVDTLLGASAAQQALYAKAYADLARSPSHTNLSASGRGGRGLPGFDAPMDASPHGGSAGASEKTTRRTLLLSFAVNVVLPLAQASRIQALDFPTLSLVVFSSIDKGDAARTQSAEGRAWRQVVAQYFETLSQVS